MSFDSVALVQVTYDKKNILENLMALYLHDLSEFADDLMVNADGKFEYDGLEYYFKSEDLRPFFIYYDNEIAGFVLLNSGRYVSIGVNYSIHEFFVLKSFRKKGIGSKAVKAIFEQYKGKYKIVQLIDNKPAIGFWRNLYASFGIKYNEMAEKSDGIEGLMQIFDIV